MRGKSQKAVCSSIEKKKKKRTGALFDGLTAVISIVHAFLHFLSYSAQQLLMKTTKIYKFTLRGC